MRISIDNLTSNPPRWELVLTIGGRDVPIPKPDGRQLADLGRLAAGRMADDEAVELLKSMVGVDVTGWSAEVVIATTAAILTYTHNYGLDVGTAAGRAVAGEFKRPGPMPRGRTRRRS